MKSRGDVFWAWGDPSLHHRTHEETLKDGTCIDVQVRLSRASQVEMFIGIYAPDGTAVHEEAIDARPGESMTRVLAWGVGLARERALAGDSGRGSATSAK